ncbi:MAG: putative RNA-binding protein (virulence factor B family) [Bacteroidia bacterium]|jgi:predicted RNA-binding protein (virulence factor B family)
MIEVGKLNKLTVLRDTSVGMFLGDLLGGEVLLPIKYIPENTKVDDELEVFIYKDSEDRIIATNLTPLAQLNSFACLTVSDVSSVGAFLDWGLEKDLLVPYREQNIHLEVGKKILVYVYLDETSNRIVASCRLKKFLSEDTPTFEEGEEVDLIVWHPTELGYNVLINEQFSGVVYANEIFEKLHQGERRKGYIKQVRPDGKIDVSLQKLGYDQVLSSIDPILQKLQDAGGTLPIGDKSDPDLIYRLLGMSKKNFKKAIGSLYKAGKIEIEPNSIRLKE